MGVNDRWYDENYPDLEQVPDAPSPNPVTTYQEQNPEYYNTLEPGDEKDDKK